MVLFLHRTYARFNKTANKSKASSTRRRNWKKIKNTYKKLREKKSDQQLKQFFDEKR